MFQTVPPGRTPTALPSSLRDVRRARKKSLRDISERAGIHKSQLSRFERGQGGLSLDALYRLARALEVTELADQLQPLVKEHAS